MNHLVNLEWKTSYYKMFRTVTEIGDETGKCDMCFRDIDKPSPALFQEQIEYLESLRVDEFWIKQLKRTEKDAYYAICADCWIYYVNGAVKASTFRMKERRAYNKAVKEELKEQLEMCDLIKDEAEQQKIEDLIVRGQELLRDCKTCGCGNDILIGGGYLLDFADPDSQTCCSRECLEKYGTLKKDGEKSVNECS